MKSIFLYPIALLFVICACTEQRFEIGSNDKTPPHPPVLREVKPLYGGARIFYTRPADEDLITVDAEFTAANGKIFKFSASYFKDSLDVYGLGNTEEHTIKLFATDRAGNRSSVVLVPVTPLEPSISRVAKTLIVKPGFGSFYVDWTNELEQTVNVYVDFNFTQNGYYRDLVSVYSSNMEHERKFVNDLELGPDEAVNIKIRVEDIYGNITESVDFGSFYLLQDEKIPKAGWVLPLTNDSIAGVPMCFGSGFDGRIGRVIDDNTDELLNGSNYMHTGAVGQTGSSSSPNVPWSLIIDLGDYYELSRIITHQRHNDGGLTNIMQRGTYYQGENVGIYNMYVLDEEANEWIFLSNHIIPYPTGLNDLEIAKMGHKGDQAYMFPDDPDFTKPARFFRYEAINGFNSNYTNTDCNCLSEVTLYGRKAR
ncbi:hypothetical protein EZS27_023025 [termite gut metagenome]|uniref:DUF4959 domain-containing protein n=1 Tax=termite gut metagenome TaxID=433724 RepID=A0A5J4R392_9ZZZZ